LISMESAEPANFTEDVDRFWYRNCAIRRRPSRVVFMPRSPASHSAHYTFQLGLDSP
jgi:hypothetical protein